MHCFLYQYIFIPAQSQILHLRKKNHLNIAWNVENSCIILVSIDFCNVTKVKGLLPFDNNAYLSLSNATLCHIGTTNVCALKMTILIKFLSKQCSRLPYFSSFFVQGMNELKVNQNPNQNTYLFNENSNKGDKSTNPSCWIC